MKPPPFAYARAGSVEDAVELLAADEDAKVLAGGQSLVPMLNFRFARPSTLVDVAHIEALRGIERRNGVLAVGAAVRQLDAERSPLVAEACPLIGQALRHVGHLQIRSRGTIGGSVAHADPAAELPAVALALDAELVAAGPAGQRVIAAQDFFVGPYMTTLEDNEVLVETRFGVLDARTAFVEYARRSGDFAQAGIAVAVTYEADGVTVALARLAAMGIGSAPRRLTVTEERLQGERLTEDLIGRAAAETEIVGEVHDEPTLSYKTDLLRTLLTRGLREVTA
ncbi:MAG: aerobic carbon-monoxide dehydrogenase medium subunit [Thermoleophilaceae bacterium]|nr:aerobic carbon-monoxide dehydrogenase medium subunit [Thermoleophilaceae bacterium]